MFKKYIFFFTLSVFSFAVSAQTTFPVNGVHDKNHNYTAFKNATIFLDGDRKIENATMLINDGKIVQIGNAVVIPKNTVVYDLTGKYIYPSFIDLYSDYGLPSSKKPKKGNEENHPNVKKEETKKGAYGWNPAIHPEFKAQNKFNIDQKEAEELRKIGFGSVLTHYQDGIARGTASFVSLDDESNNLSIINGNAAAWYSFKKGKSQEDYPSSLMGSIALLRQTYYDAKWYQSNLADEYNISLDAFNSIQTLPQFFDATDYLTVLRADKVGDEFGKQYFFKGNGDEYKRISDIKNTNGKFIIPVNYPKAFDVEDPYDALLISLEDMKHWELAPTNANVLYTNQIEFAFTADGLENKKDFFKNIKKAIENGLPANVAINALTKIPAQFINAQDKVGTLDDGKLANFIITSDSLFADECKIYENWVVGKRMAIEDYTLPDIVGNYSLNINGKIFKLTVKGKEPSYKAFVKTETDSTKHNVTLKRDGDLISLAFNINDDLYRLSGNIATKSAIWHGMGQVSEGDWVKWSTIKSVEKIEEKEEEKTDSVKKSIGVVWYPNMAYGLDSVPNAVPTLIKNIRVWTNEKEGILENADVLLYKGKIHQIGKDILVPEGAVVINGKGKQLTPGIIDEHSHIAISRGVNEGSQSISAEVSIADVVNPDDVNIYRQLAGGITAAQLLHGSANPIGGQSALVKLRWGRNAEEMKIKGADGFIKFALGENVKRSNWGSGDRFPQTRMGVEQVYYDAFTRAKEYQKEWAAYKKLTPKQLKKNPVPAPRRDLELDILVEILEAKRFITCHSYVQSEINMLMHVADSMGFKVNTFTHILEGYKVADKMKAHGVAGSTFSDWWAYKFEVNDAIPYNAALMNEKGIVVAINSDDAEMGRRLNQEAAKAVKYGNVSEEDALKMVTLNPAKMLHLDSMMGSIKVGKDADVVIWSGHPLSIYSKVEKTFIDGICYYDAEKNEIINKQIQAERIRLINKMIEAKKNGEATQSAKPNKKPHYHCDGYEIDEDY